jgi:hypothetical protein
MPRTKRNDVAELRALLEQLGLSRGMRMPQGPGGPGMAMMGGGIPGMMMGKGEGGMMGPPALMQAAERRQMMMGGPEVAGSPDDSEEGALLQKLKAWWGGSGEEKESRDVAEEMNKKLPGEMGARKGLKKNRQRRKAAEDAAKE